MHIHKHRHRHHHESPHIFRHEEPRYGKQVSWERLKTAGIFQQTKKRPVHRELPWERLPGRTRLITQPRNGPSILKLLMPKLPLLVKTFRSSMIVES